MKLVREHINEKFIEDSDPISDMGIGGMCTTGSIIKTKNDVACTNKDVPYCTISTRGDSYMQANTFWVVTKFRSSGKDYIIRVKGMENLKHATLYAKHKRNNSYTNWTPFNIKLSFNEFKEYFEVVPI
jgi:hypothetical protein